MSAVNAEQLKQFISRIENLAEEKEAISEDIKSIFGEARAFGYDVKIMRKILAIRKRDKEEISEENALISLYASALGMQLDMFEEAA